jgi:prefoldin subunit 5
MSDAVDADESEADLRENLQRIEEEIEELRQELDGLREEMRDWEDGGTATQLVEEQEAVIAMLERHRMELLERLGRK